MWKCKECKTEIIEDYRQMTDEQEEHIADWEEEDERD